MKCANCSRHISPNGDNPGDIVVCRDCETANVVEKTVGKYGNYLRLPSGEEKFIIDTDYRVMLFRTFLRYR